MFLVLELFFGAKQLNFFQFLTNIFLKREILTCEYPYNDFLNTHSSIPLEERFVRAICIDGIRPTMQKPLPPGLSKFSKILDSCWKYNPDERFIYLNVS